MRSQGQATIEAVALTDKADPVTRTNVLGVGISAVNLRSAPEIIDGWIKAGARKYVCVTGVHGVMESQSDDELRGIHNAAGMVTPDGMPMVWLSRWHGHKHVGRVYGPDLMLEVFRRSAAAGYRHYFYGGADGVPEKLTEAMTGQFPKALIAGTYSPPFRALTDEEDAAIVHRINECAPDIVWVGLSTPKQERWMASHVGRLRAPVLIGVGAAFDFHAELKRQAPKWIQHSGFEWLYRMLQEPQRLTRRYMVNNPAFLIKIALQLLGVKQYRLDG